MSSNIKVFTLPGPGRTTKVSFERPEGERGWAELVIEGPMIGLWRDDKGGYASWPDLLMAHEPLTAVRVSPRGGH